MVVRHPHTPISVPRFGVSSAFLYSIGGGRLNDNVENECAWSEGMHRSTYPFHVFLCKISISDIRCPAKQCSFSLEMAYCIILSQCQKEMLNIRIVRVTPIASILRALDSNTFEKSDFSKVPVQIHSKKYDFLNVRIRLLIRRLEVTYSKGHSSTALST